MTFENSIHYEIQQALDLDLPIELMPLTISSLANQLAGCGADRMGCGGWD